MTNIQRIQANNEDLMECIRIAEELPLANGSSGDSDKRFKELIEGTLTEINDSSIEKVDSNALSRRSFLTVNLPSATYIDASAFYYCDRLTSVNLPSATYLGTSALSYCDKLTIIDLPSITEMSQSVFLYCSRLKSVVIRQTERICKLTSANAFTSTPISSATGYIYVPRALLSDNDSTKDYRRATNWSTYASQFRAIEDYSVDGTLTGEINPNKPQVQTYTIRFMNGDEVLQSSQVPYGEMPTFEGGEPTKDEHQFMGWIPEIGVVTGDVDYVANFKSMKSQTRALVDRTITKVDNVLITSIGKTAFRYCSSLTVLILRSETMCTLSNSDGLSYTPIAIGDGYIYVPRALLSDTDTTKDYRQATNWSTFASKFRAIEDYPEICGGDN